jgi:folate-binding protein YgfZ
MASWPCTVRLLRSMRVASSSDPGRVLPSLPKAGLVCRSCRQHQQQQQQHRHQRRSYASSTASTRENPPAGLASLSSSRQLLSLAGPDAAKFLQGIITGNVTGDDGLPRRDAFYAGFLNATGRVLHDVFVYPQKKGLAGSEDGSGFLIEVDSSCLDGLARYIKRYKLRSKVAVRKITPDELTVWQAWDDAAGNQFNPPADDSSIVFRDPRAPGLGYRIIQATQQRQRPQLELDETTEDAYTIRRYLNGVPEGQDEILREHALPQESNMDMMNGIEFHKGCYVGQELTIRTKHRGVVRKRILPCVIYDKRKAPPQTLAYEPASGESDSDSSPSSSSLESPTADMIPAGTSIGRFEKRGRSAGKWLKGVPAGDHDGPGAAGGAGVDVARGRRVSAGMGRRG